MTMPNPVAEAVSRLREAADNIERARMSGIVENLAGWEQRHARDAADLLERQQAEVERLSRESADHEAVHASHRQLVRRLDVILNGETGAAPQARLCDVVAQLERLSRERDTVIEECIAVVGKPRTIDAMRGDVAVPDCAQDIIADLRALQGQPRERDTGVPEGFWLAPNELDDAMIEACAGAFFAAFDKRVSGSRPFHRWYEAIRAAAPQPPTVSTQGWQDISTAKTGATVIIAAISTAPSSSGRWIVGEAILLEDDDDHRDPSWWWASAPRGEYHSDDVISMGAIPKAWQPLPAPPGSAAPQHPGDPDLSTLTRERDQAREALAFYANQDNWNEDGQCFAGRVPVPMWASDDHGDTFIDGHLDLGATARSVLHHEKEEKA